MSQPDSVPKSALTLEGDPSTKIQNWLVSRIAEKLTLEPDQIDTQVPLDTYGLNSAQALSLISEGETYLGFEISPMLLWHYPTIEALSQRLAEEAEDPDLEAFEI